MPISSVHSSRARPLSAVAFGFLIAFFLLAFATTPASAQCDPWICTNPYGTQQLRLAPQARAEPLCLFDPVVWVNTKSRVYYAAGSRGYGHGRYGAYMCEAEARTAGNRAGSR